MNGDRGSDAGEIEFPRSWDLTNPPDRESVQLADGEDTVFFEVDMDKPRDVAFHLPAGVSLTVPLYMVSFDSFGGVPAEESAPTGLDARSGRMSLDETVELYRSVLNQLNMDTGAVAAFSDEAKAAQQNGQGQAPDSGRVSTRLKSREYGYLTLKLAAIYRPRADQGFIKLMGSWQPK